MMRNELSCLASINASFPDLRPGTPPQPPHLTTHPNTPNPLPHPAHKATTRTGSPPTPSYHNTPPTSKQRRNLGTRAEIKRRTTQVEPAQVLVPHVSTNVSRWAKKEYTNNASTVSTRYPIITANNSLILNSRGSSAEVVLQFFKH